MAGLAVDRRTLLVGGGAGLGLLLAWRHWPREAASALPDRDGEKGVNAWLRITPDGRAVVALPQAETGQGSWTGLAQLLADELGARWDSVAVEPAPPGGPYANAVATADWAGFEPTRVTLAGSSTRAFASDLRHAGAMARALLTAEAAERWSLDPAAVDIVDGQAVAGRRRIAIGALADSAARRRPPADARLRAPGAGALAGRPLPRLDLPAKLDGSLRFAADVRLRGLAYAAFLLAPPGGRIAAADIAAARAGKGVFAIEQGEGWIAAVGETSWAALAALERARVRRTGPAGADSAAIARRVRAALAAPGATRLVERGDADGAIAGGAGIVSADYVVEAAAPASLEPMAITLRPGRGRLEIWAGVLAYDRALALAAEAADLPQSAVTLYPAPVGGTQGRGLDLPLLAPAVALAMRLNRPLQAFCGAAESRHHDRCRPPLAMRLSAAPYGPTIRAWKARLATAPGVEAALHRLGAGPMPDAPLDALEGAVPPYTLGALALDYAPLDLPPAASGYVAGGGAAAACFATECFVDEVARTLGAEPLSFRVGMLSGDLRLARLLTLAGTIAGWDGGAPGSHMGLACARLAGSYIALVAEAALDEQQRPRVSRLVAMVDCGRVTNPALARQRVEMGLLAALAEGLAPAARFHAGLTVADAHPPGLSGALPSVVVELAESNEEPGGVSPLAAAVLPAALANALFAATGRRLRRWPLMPMDKP